MPVRSMTRRILTGGLVALALAGPALAQSISGSYRAEGRNPDGTAYSGTVQITERGGAVAMTWSIAGQSYQGTGERNGDVIIVNWGDTYPVVYVRMPSGELHGTWANGAALERLIP
ncbi:hypothetical protein [Shimia biformata]|uniref:LIC10280 family protein n=1 Tax=Shimia biformata TaxID=1294299 RepID=UPI001950F110|nr:hypothetical protein [Shimia biformata]